MATQYPDYEIVFTGHSLGGAEAHLGAVDFYLSNTTLGDRISLITFGQPRVGNVAWANFVESLPFASRYARIVRQKDPVPHVGFRNHPLMDFAHAGQQFEISDNGQTIQCATSGPAGESDQCMSDIDANSIGGALKNTLNLWFHVTGKQLQDSI